MNKLINKMEGLPRKWLSWSQISSLQFGNYVDTYIYGKKQSNQFLDFGKTFAEAMEHYNSKVPKHIEKIRKQIPNFPKKEVEIKAIIDGIPVIGYFDALDIKKETIIELKTGKKPSPKFWRDGQLSLYSLLYFKNYGKLPKNVRLYYCRTIMNSDDQLIFSPDKVQVFDFNIEIRDILRITTQIIKTYKAIQELCEKERWQFGKLPFDG